MVIRGSHFDPTKDTSTHMSSWIVNNGQSKVFWRKWPGIILSMYWANDRQHCNVTSSLIGQPGMANLLHNFLLPMAMGPVKLLNSTVYKNNWMRGFQSAQHTKLNLMLYMVCLVYKKTQIYGTSISNQTNPGRFSFTKYIRPFVWYVGLGQSLCECCRNLRLAIHRDLDMTLAGLKGNQGPEHSVTGVS